MKNYTLHEKLKEVVESAPNQIAMQIKKASDYEHYTYQEFYHRAIRISQSLIAAKIQKGNRICIMLENRLDWGCIYFGILMSGAIAVPIDPQSTPEDIHYFLEHSESKIIFTSQQWIEPCRNLFQNQPLLQKVILLDDENEKENKIEDFQVFISQQNSKQQPPEITPNDVASILYTSGTTSVSKGVMLTHGNLYSDFACVEKMGALSGQHNFLSILPLHHAFPLMATLLFPLFVKNKITYLASLKQEEIFTCIKESKVTLFVGVPQLFGLIAQAIQNEIAKMTFYARLPLKEAMNILWLTRRLTHLNFSKLLFKKIHSKFGKQFKYLASGGAKFDKNAEILLNKVGFTFIQGYGLTETSPVVTFNPVNKPRIGSAGKLIPNVDVKIEKTEGLSNGEVLVRGPNVMKGYYKDQNATDEVMKEGWLHTGDLGYLDKSNYLFLTGRKKEIIVLSNGKNISPEEVENHYSQSQYIKEICVLAVPEGDDEKLMAIILPDFEHFKKINEVNIDFSVRWDVENFSKNLPAYKRIRGFILAKQEFPKTRLGKLKRYEIETKYKEEILGGKSQKEEYEPTEGDLELLSSPVYEKIKTTIEKEFHAKEPVQLSDHLELDLGFDSLNRVELIASLEKEFHLKISEQEFAKIVTIKDLTKTVEKLINDPSSRRERTAEKSQKINVWKTLLQTNPATSMLEKINLIPTFMAKTVTALSIGLLWVLFKLFFKFKFYDTNHLPQNGPYMICPNHVSFLDAFFISVALPKKIRLQTFFLGYTGYFEAPMIRSIVKLWRIIPIDPALRLIDAMQATSYVLRNKKIVGLFPEARRSIDGTVQSFKQGAGILAKELNVDIVPAYIKGAFEAWPRTNRFPKAHRIEVRFGKPCSSEELKVIGLTFGAKTDYEAITLGLREKIQALSMGAL